MRGLTYVPGMMRINSVKVFSGKEGLRQQHFTPTFSPGKPVSHSGACGFSGKVMKIISPHPPLPVSVVDSISRSVKKDGYYVFKRHEWPLLSGKKEAYSSIDQEMRKLIERFGICLQKDASSGSKIMACRARALMENTSFVSMPFNEAGDVPWQKVTGCQDLWRVISEISPVMKLLNNQLPEPGRELWLHFREYRFFKQSGACIMLQPHRDNVKLSVIVPCPAVNVVGTVGIYDNDSQLMVKAATPSVVFFDQSKVLHDVNMQVLGDGYRLMMNISIA